MTRIDTWTRAARHLIARWTRGNCGAINPDTTGNCIRCGLG